MITSKVYFKTGEDQNAMGASRYHIVRAVEASLKRMKTDYIDLYFIHRFDDRTDFSGFPESFTVSPENGLL